MHILLGLDFHFALLFFAFFASVFFQTCVLSSAFVVLSHMFVVKFILVSSFFLFCTMSTIVMKEDILVVVVDDLDFGIINVVFEAKVLNRYDTFD